MQKKQIATVRRNLEQIRHSIEEAESAFNTDADPRAAADDLSSVILLATNLRRRLAADAADPAAPHPVDDADADKTTQHVYPHSAK